MKPLYCLLAALCATACAKNPQKPPEIDESERRYHYTWSREGATEADFKREMYDCETGIQQRMLMSTQAMNQYKYSRMHMGVFGLGLEEPTEIEEEELPKMLTQCMDVHGWKAKKTPVVIAPGQDYDETTDTHSYQTN